MKIRLVGATGGLGTAVGKALTGRGSQVITVGRTAGDIVTEVAIITDGDEGLFVGYDEVEFLAPVHTGDFVEVTGTVTRIGTTSRTVQLEARKVIASRYDQSPTGADVLDEPVVVIRATGTIVVTSRLESGCGARERSLGRWPRVHADDSTHRPPSRTSGSAP